jgi:tRNA-2-methylthio-N6-dimethylallyladenosine synthase
MKRPYRIELVEKIISEFKKNYPDMTIATDIIVGYPTETEIDHQLNLKFLEKYKPDVLNLSKFSSHKGTLAGRSKILDKKIINKRAFELMDLHRKTSMENKLKYKNKEIELFVNSKSKIPGIFESRDENYNIVLINSKDRSILGKKIFVKVIKTGVHHMIGEII